MKPHTFLESMIAEFRKEFPCIHSDCDGTGCIAVAKSVPRQISDTEFVEDTEWEAKQCDFHYEYLLPMEYLITRSFTAFEKQIREEEKSFIREKVKELGHQQDDDSIWCKMDDILSLPELTIKE